VLRSDRGKTVLIDTGLPSDYTVLNAAIRCRKGAWAGFRNEGSRLAKRLAEENISPDAIVLTSFGPYAVGGLPDVRARRIFVSARGLADLREGEVDVFRHPLAADIEEAIAAASDAVTGKAEPFAGLTLYETGIHHPASMAIIIETVNGSVAIVDPIFHSENLRRGIPLGVAEYPAHWVRMVSELTGRVDAILPIHDPVAEPVRVEEIDVRLRRPVRLQQESIVW
jgi:glyoxylase-like metal-dependent hydrolase (beta-lactamase superfamily II)